MSTAAVKRRPLGQMLVQRSLLLPPQLKKALELQRQSGDRLASHCVQRQLLNEREALITLTAQVGVPGVHLARLVLPLRFLDVVPRQLALKHAVLPVRVDPARVFLALADPHDDALLSELAFTSGRQVLPCVALHGPLEQAIRAAYEAKESGELEYRGELVDDAAVNAALDFIYAEELSQVPVELIRTLNPEVSHQGQQPADGGEQIVIETSDVPSATGELEIALEGDGGVSIEVRERGGESGEYPPPNRPTEAQARVLVVDDDSSVRELVKRVLGSRGMEVEEAARGLEALAQIRREPPDLILLDAMLPEIHGFDICRKIKNSERYGKIPVIMISSVYRGWRFAEDLKESYGVDEFMEKPFDMATLCSTVDRVLVRVRRRKERSRRMSVSTKKALREGVQRYKEGDLDGAIERFRDGIQADPLEPKLHYQIAILYLKKKGMVYQAMHEFEEVLALEPEMFSALRNLAILYQNRGFRNKAIDMWERALHCSPDAATREHIRKHLMTLIDQAAS